MFGRALSWGSAFAVCIVHCSLVYQFEHSGKVRRAWFKFGFKNFYSSLLSGSASFLCAALMSPQRTKQYCPQIEYILLSVNVMNRRNILLLINKGQVDQGNVVLLMLVLGIGNAWTRMWSTVYLEYFVLDSTMGKSKGE